MNSSPSLNIFTNNIVLVDGIWYSKDKSFVSYPEEGNSMCFQIEENSFWFNHRNNIILEVIKKFPPNGCFFDVGGGNGFVTKSIIDSGFDAFLLEPGHQGILNAKNRGIGNLICATLEDVEFNKANVPSIGIFDVLEHIQNDNDFIKKIFECLKPKGLLYITVPSYNILWSSEDVSAGHFRRYTLRKLTELLLKSGFKINYKSYFFSFLPIPIYLFRTLPYRFNLIKKSKDLNKHSQEHSPKKGFAGKILNFFLELEKRRIQNLNIIPFGGSCIVVAEKIE